MRHRDMSIQLKLRRRVKGTKGGRKKIELNSEIIKNFYI